MLSYRINPNGYFIAKLIAFGYDCTEPPQFERWTKPVWTTPATYVFSTFDETTTFTGPRYHQDCSGAWIDLDFEFYDLSEAQSGSLSWITIDSSTNVVTVAPTQQEFLDYDTSTISVQIKAID